MSVAYLVSSLLWAVGGLFVGYGLGRMVRDVHDVHTVIVPPPPLTVPRPPSRRRAPTGRMMIGILVMVVIAVSTVLYALESAKLNGVTSCQSQLNFQFRDALAQRSAAQGVEIAAQRKLILSRLSGQADRETAVREYLAALDALEAAGLRHPLPVAVDCGGGK